jgi:threonine synthase
MVQELRRVWETHGYLPDPHTAIGLIAASRLRSSPTPYTL